MVGLRLTKEGISSQAFWERFGEEMENVFGKEVDELVRLNLLEWIDPITNLPVLGNEVWRKRKRSIRLTTYGRLLGNQVFLHFVGD